MHHLSRFGVSLEEDLLAAFDVSIGSEGYQNRSEAIRDLARAGIREAAEDLGQKRECVAASSTPTTMPPGSSPSA